MKRILMLVIVLFSQTFLTLVNVQSAEIKPMESGKTSLYPAQNDGDGK